MSRRSVFFSGLLKTARQFGYFRCRAFFRPIPPLLRYFVCRLNHLLTLNLFLNIMLSLRKIHIRRLANSRRVSVFAISRKLALSLFLLVLLVSLTRCAHRTMIRLSGSEIEFEYTEQDSTMLRSSSRSSDK